MYRSLSSGACVAIAVSILAGCAGVSPRGSPVPTVSATVASTGLPASSPTEVGVAQISLPNAGDRWTGYCGGTGIDATLRGDPHDRAVTWLETKPGFDGSEPGRHYVTWPPGFTARFTPRLEVVDPLGQVVMREGAHIEGTCLSAADLWGTGLDCGPVPGTECVLRFAALVRDHGWPEQDLWEVDFTGADGSFETPKKITGVASLPTPDEPSVPIVSLPTFEVARRGWCDLDIADTTLQGDPLDPKVTWLEPGGDHVIWPAGFEARFTPQLEIIDPIGQVVMREGDRVDSLCRGNRMDFLQIYGFNADCGPLVGTDCTRRLASVVRAHHQPGERLMDVKFTGMDGSYELLRIVPGVAPRP